MLHPELTLLPLLNSAPITLHNFKIWILDRKLDVVFRIFEAESSFYSSVKYEEFSPESLKFELNMACFGVFNNTPGDSFYKHIYRIQQSQSSIYTSKFWWTDFNFKVERCRLSLPILEYPNRLVCITNKMHKETQSRCGLKEISMDSFWTGSANPKS